MACCMSPWLGVSARGQACHPHPPHPTPPRSAVTAQLANTGPRGGSLEAEEGVLDL